MVVSTVDKMVDVPTSTITTVVCFVSRKVLVSYMVDVTVTAALFQVNLGSAEEKLSRLPGLLGGQAFPIAGTSQATLATARAAAYSSFPTAVLAIYAAGPTVGAEIHAISKTKVGAVRKTVSLAETQEWWLYTNKGVIARTRLKGTQSTRLKVVDEIEPGSGPAIEQD